ncbi:bifunctional diguanylate cyclase/phosphodiesterase [Noviherbaspirillum massiliense]|uniref:bifunctional diguanylate cyclase/phosphodiesterase n=1 Tax=Noviherbaspirillum massiliense TaxID=1465823 RepID=UPI0002F5B5DC|nr:EAL domain-containing protein [Noviherbaspirillum massiliense]
MTVDRQLEEKLSQAEERLNFLFEFSSDWYWEQDVDFRFTLVACNAPQKSRFPPEESLGKTRWELPYVGVTEEQWEKHRAQLRARQPFRNLVLKRRDSEGRLCVTSISGAPMYDARGEFKGYRGIGTDITERRLAQQREAMEHAVTRLLAESRTVEEAMPKILETICRALDWDYGAHWGVDKQSVRLQQTHTWHVPGIDVKDFIEASLRCEPAHENMMSVEGGGVIRRAWLAREPLWMADVTRDVSYIRASAAARAGLRTAFAFPILLDENVLGVMEFYSREFCHPDPALLQSLRAIGSQIGLFCERKQLETRQAMQHSVTRLLADSAAPEQTMPELIRTICKTLGWDYGGYWSLDSRTQSVRCRAIWKAAHLDAEEFLQRTREKVIFVQHMHPQRDGHLTRLWTSRKPVWVDDIGKPDVSACTRVQQARRHGLHSVFAFPILAGQEVIGAIEFFSRNIRQPDDILIDTASSIGIQIGEFCRRKEAEERVHYLAYYDSLTGLPNRILFNQRLQHGLSSAQRTGARLAVLFIDMDRFKNINDTLGHDAGDHLLQETARRFTSCVRASDTVARLGGDEFVVLLEDIDDPRDAAAVARKIIESALAPLRLMHREYHVSASVGISLFPDDGKDAQTLMKHADIAMYLAKAQGKNNYQFYSARINLHSSQRLALESSLRHALARGELLLHYQPKVDLASGRITGAEALLRWMHPDLGMVPPTQFIPIAEETGLIVPIGRWVIDTACAQNKAWQDQGLPKLCVAVNLSARQFNDGSLTEDLARALESSGLPPELLQLEITESMVMADPDDAARILSGVQAMGVSIAIDDFGTGYSSLSQLKRFPINTLKVDRSFIQDLSTSSEDAAIAGAIIAMGRALKLNVVAEGVEHPEQASFLREHHCCEAQGYHFGRPMPADELADLLRSAAS